LKRIRGEAPPLIQVAAWLVLPEQPFGKTAAKLLNILNKYCGSDYSLIRRQPSGAAQIGMSSK